MHINTNNSEIEAFVNDLLGMNINSDTIFFKDLNLIGHDANEFMLRFSEKFDIDLSDFKFEDYFLEEYTIPFLYWFDFLFRKNKIKRRTFNLEHLRNIIIQKKWID